MLLSRFWYVVLGLVLGGAIFVLSLAVSMYNRAGARAMGEALSADSQVVSWYLQNDARLRAAQLTKFALDADITKHLSKSSGADAKVPQESRDATRSALAKVAEGIPADQSFDAVFAVDQHGRVVAHLGYEQASGMEDFELGGYPVVADALHGYIRDDTLVLDRVYRVVARPVQLDLGQMPAGAIVGARIIDERFARELSKRTGAAVAFYATGQRVASAAPEGFDKSQLDQIVADLGALEADEDYKSKGRSNIRSIGGLLGVVYAKLPGETWDLGAGYAVGRLPVRVKGPLGFFQTADDKDKEQANVVIAGALALAAALLGILFSVVEHTRPLMLFRREAVRLSKGETDQLQPSKFRGVYRKIASDVNDGIDQVLAKGGTPRKGAVELKQVLGDLPDQPQMSAFSFPGESPSSPGMDAAPAPAASKPRPPAPPPTPAAVAAAKAGPRPPPPRRAAEDAEEASETSDWPSVYEEFVRTKQQCGENVEGFTFEKFSQTLQKNRDALVKRHGAARVRFTVYVKDGKAALKASPIKD